MALTKCKACGAEMSKKAAACPKCGHPNKEANYLSGSQVFFGLAIATAVIWWLASSDSGSVSTPNPKRVALENMELTDITWKKDGFGSVMVMSATIKNNGASAVKDVEIDCDHSSNSGTKLDSNSGVVYEIVPAGKSVKINDFSMGFIHSQAASTNCKITDVVPL